MPTIVAQLESALIKDFVARANTVLAYNPKSLLKGVDPRTSESLETPENISDEGKKLLSYQNYLTDVRSQLIEEATWALSRSKQLAKELVTIVKVFDSKKGSLTRGHLKALSLLADAVHKAMLNLDLFKTQIENVYETVEDMKAGSLFIPQKKFNELSPEEKKEMGVEDLKTMDQDLKQGEISTKFKKFFENVGKGFGLGPKAPVVQMTQTMLATACVAVAKDLIKE